MTQKAVFYFLMTCVVACALSTAVCLVFVAITWGTSLTDWLALVAIFCGCATYFAFREFKDFVIESGESQR